MFNRKGNLEASFIIIVFASSAAHRIQRSCGSHVRQEANFQHVEQEVLIVDAIHSVKEQHHGSLVVWHETGRHLWLNNLAICCWNKQHNSCKRMLMSTILQRFNTSIHANEQRLSTNESSESLTFAKGGDLHRQADDSHQVLYGHQGPQNGPDPQSFTLTSLDQLQMQNIYILNQSNLYSSKTGLLMLKNKIPKSYFTIWALKAGQKSAKNSNQLMKCML